MGEPADLGLGLHKRGRGSGKAAGLAEEPADLPAFGKGNTCNVCSGDYYGDCDFYSVKVAPAARPPGAVFAGWHGHACCARCRGTSVVCCLACTLLVSCLFLGAWSGVPAGLKCEAPSFLDHELLQHPWRFCLSSVIALSRYFDGSNARLCLAAWTSCFASWSHDQGLCKLHIFAPGEWQPLIEARARSGGAHGV